MSERGERASHDAPHARAPAAAPAPPGSLETLHPAPPMADPPAEGARWYEWGLAALGLAAVAVGIAWLNARGAVVDVPPTDLPLRIALLTGDTVVAAPGSRLELRSQELSVRRIRVARGSALFSVLPLRDAQRFDVETEQAHVSARGTVFTVAVDGDRTTVRVYDGNVQVDGKTLEARAAWASDGKPAAVDPLRTQADDAVRMHHASPVPTRLHAPPAAPAVPTTATPTEPARASRTLVTPSETERASTIAAPPPSAATESSTTSTASMPPPGAPTEAQVDHELSRVRAQLAAGDEARALEATEAGVRRGDGEWLLLSADALRALGRFAEAVDRYEQAAQTLTGAPRSKAGYAAASVALYHLQDAARSLRLIAALSLDADDAPLRERASVLHVDALLASGDVSGARREARRYLAREPDRITSGRMRVLAR